MDRVFNQNVNSNKKSLLWLIPVLLVIVLLAVIIPVMLNRARERERQAAMAQTGEKLFQALSVGDVSNSLALLAEYRTLAEPTIPDETRDDLFRLDRKNFPLYTEQVNEWMLEDILFFLGVTENAGKTATSPRHLTINMLGFLMRNVQSGGGREEAKKLFVIPAQVLRRGYGNPVQLAWLYAKLLRYSGLHTSVIYLEQPEGQEPYALAGVAIDGKLLLFDPYHAVPVSRKNDGAIADLASLVSGQQELDEMYSGTPVTIDALKKAIYFVPTEPANILPDALFLNRVLQEGGRKEGFFYRPFRRDLRNMAAAVFGEGAKVEDNNIAFLAKGRDEVVALWDHPFRLEALFTDPRYAEKVADAHKVEQALLIPRHVQLLGNRDIALAEYEKIISQPENPEAVEEAEFFKSLSTAGQKERIEAIAAFLEKYPDSRRRPLALLILAELNAIQNNKEEALKIAGTIPAPYDLRAKKLIKALEANQQGIVWTFPPNE